MFRATGIDIGSTGTRRVSVGIYWGSPQPETEATPGGQSIVNMPSDKLTFRSLGVPSAGRDIQGRVIREELSYSLPFSIDEAVWDWTVREETATVTVALQKELAQLREQITPDTTVDAEPISYLRALLAAGLDEALIFDFGASRTTVCAIKDKAIDWVRVSFRGGQSLTRAIGKKYQLNENEAERRKIANGMQEEACRQWLADIVKASLLQLPIPFTKVLICGGGAAMSGLNEELSKQLEQSVEMFPLPAGLNPCLDTAAFGAALAARPRMPHVRLYHEEPETQRIQISYLLLTVLLMGLATADIEVRHANAASSYAAHSAIISAAVKEQLPDLASAKIADLPSELQKRCETNRNIRRRSPDLLLTTLAGLAAPLRNADGMEVRRLEYKEEASSHLPLLNISGQAASAKQAESFRTAATGILEQPELVDSRAGANGTTTFTIEGKLPPQ